ncbi:MAG: hypothetical protein V8Q55_05020 [Christensenellales bacterium]
MFFISSVKIVAKATAIRRRAYRREPCLIYHAANRAITLYSQNKMDKNSNHNYVRVLAWCWRAKHASG